MERSKKALKATSIILLIFAVLELISIITLVAMGENAPSVKGYSFDAHTVDILIGVVITFVAISLLINLFLGIKGLRVAKGLGKGKGHITLATILIVLYIISIVVGIIGAIASTHNWFGVIVEIVSLIILVIYRTSAKTIANPTIEE